MTLSVVDKKTQASKQMSRNDGVSSRILTGRQSTKS